MKVSIIIVHWNTPTQLKKLLTLLGSSNEQEIIVIDNNSSYSLSLIKKTFPHITVIENKLNRGYAAACNQGTVVSEGEWLLFLNPDIEITQNEVKSFIKEAEEKNLDACSPISSDSLSSYRKPLYSV